MFKIVLLILSIVIISVLYYFLILYLIIGFNKVNNFEIINTSSSSNQRFSIIIPFRNETENILELTHSLSQINYSNTDYEILFVDDESTDNSVDLLTPFLSKNKHWKLLDNQRNSNSPKKDAINTAIQVAKYKWIITTDADCKVPETWLHYFNDFIHLNQEKSINLNMIVAPVAYETNKTFIQNFQNMDFLSLIGSTIGAFGIGKPFLCNGANLCYKKEVFLSLNGFKGNDTIASGDDIFLMEKFLLNNSQSVQYLKSKEVLVLTKPENTFKNLLTQRIRWASKTSATKNKFGKFVGILVFLMNLIIIFGLSFIIYSLFFKGLNFEFLIFILIILGSKFVIDFLLIQKTYKFIGLNNGLTVYFLSSIFYPFFVVLVVFLSFFKKYEWKGRTFNK